MVVTVAQDVDGAAAAAACVSETHLRLAEFLRAGQTLAEIDQFVASTLKSMDCRSCFLRYRIPGHPPFPSYACLSLNDCIVHGTHTMTDEPIKSGDVFSVDIGVTHRGWIGDAAWTYGIEAVADEAMSLMRCGRESLQLGVAAMQPERPLIDWARAVQHFVEDECGFHLVRGLGGHGYGRRLHESPFISNVVPKHRMEWPDAWSLFHPGQLLAVEPMIAVGTARTSSSPKDWPIFSADSSLTVHYEADVLITADGPRNLTEDMLQLPDIVG